MSPPFLSSSNMGGGSDRISVGVFGSTGSIGTQTLDVIEAQLSDFRVQVLSAHRNRAKIVEQAKSYKPSYVALTQNNRDLAADLPKECEVVPTDKLGELAAECDISVNGIVGFAGLDVTLGCLNGGKRLALANKESMIAAGPVVQQARRTQGAEIVPVDSEHAAIAQCLSADDHNEHRSALKLQLTASGGPFRQRTDLDNITLEEALSHPTWTMGPKITVDSSTLINKGLEVIEAYELFGVPSGSNLTVDDIEVVIHPQSVVHSMVTFSDGSTIAQLSNPDMRGPISYALRYPQRSAVSFGALDFSKAMTLEFEAPDRNRFRALDLAYQAAKTGNAAPAWLNAANEVAVEAFLAGMIKWNAIVEVSERVLSKYDSQTADSLTEVLEADQLARMLANDQLSAV